MRPQPLPAAPIASLALMLAAFGASAARLPADDAVAGTPIGSPSESVVGVAVGVAVGGEQQVDPGESLLTRPLGTPIVPVLDVRGSSVYFPPAETNADGAAPFVPTDRLRLAEADRYDELMWGRPERPSGPTDSDDASGQTPSGIVLGRPVVPVLPLSPTSPTLPPATPETRPVRRPSLGTDAPTLANLLAAEAMFAAGGQVEIAQTPTLDPGWWQPLVAQPLSPSLRPVPLSLEAAIVKAVHHSKQVQVFADLPLIRQTAIVEADAAFDWQTFLESRWDDTSDPVGNSLTAGAGIDRFRDHHLTAQGGARKRTLSGGQLLAAQQFGIQENNSEFFVPNNQGTARLTLSFTQPLLRGRGRAYNSSLVCLAQLDKTVADDEFRRQLQTHLLEVTRAYWALYFERGVLLQKMNVYRRARTTVARLEARKRIDASESQIRSAQAALKARGAELIRARVAVKNAGSKLRSLINDPALGTSETTELMPIDRPQFATFPAPMGGSLQEAIQSRPEVHQAIKQIRAAGMRLSMSRNELMPLLNVVTEAYVAGLEDDRSIGDAWTKQFDEGEPGYAIGLQFEVPIGNRAARARHIRRCHELRQVQNQYALALSTIELDVRTSVREVNASLQELSAKAAAMQARVDQMDYIRHRWQRLPSDGTSAVLTLENLLLAQERVADAEFDYLQSQMTYNLALTGLKRATGTLLQHERVTIGTGTENGLPTQFLDKH